MRCIVVLALLLAGCAGTDEPQPPTPLQRELSGLAETMEVSHPDLFHDVSRETFRAEAAKLSRDAPGLSRDELVVGVMRLAALPGARDGHTAVYPFDRTHAACTSSRCGSTTSPTASTSSARSGRRI